MFSQVLEDNETLVIAGHQRYSDYQGYAATFRWNGDYVDHTQRDAWGRHITQVVAMDALVQPVTSANISLYPAFRSIIPTLAHVEFELGDPGSNPGSCRYSTG